MAGEAQMLDIDRFESPDAAKQAVALTRVFDDAAFAALSTTTDLSVLTLFVMSAIARARGLYEGTAREIERDNPHAVFPLMRQFAETVAMSLYVADHPGYVEALTERPRERAKGAPARKSVQALIDHVEKHYAAQFGKVYAELSEIAHFGSVALWAAHRVDGDEPGSISWSSAPRWRSDQQLYVACAQLLELREAMSQAIGRLGDALKAELSPRIGRI